MHRPYTAEGYLGVLDRVRSTIPGVAITTDVIVGFPGESPEEFEESLATVKTARFAKAHVFPFSPRPGTEAADLPGHVHPDEKKARMVRMLAVAELAERDFWSEHVGRRETVLWERGGQGLTDNYLRVHCSEGVWNEFIDLVPGWGYSLLWALLFCSIVLLVEHRGFTRRSVHLQPQCAPGRPGFGAG